MRILAALIASATLPAGGVQWWNAAPAGNSLLVTGTTTGRLCEFSRRQEHVQRAWAVQADMRQAAGVAARDYAGGRQSRDAFHVAVTVAGNVVMHFEDASDTRPQYVSVQDVPFGSTTSRQATARRCSGFDARTGKLLQRTAMPQLERPVMVANGDGLWLDPATNGGISGGNGNNVPVLHVAFGASTPIVVHRGGRAAMWMAASAHTVWFEQCRVAPALRSGGSTVQRCGS